jgi:hypothetical protein
MDTYNSIVDLMGSQHLNGKTVLYIMDGLYAGDRHDAEPKRWKMEPFNDHWPSSIFASQDPVAIDSVGLDFIAEEWALIANADNYLHEAALAHNPPSGTQYAPNGVRLASLGVHEHWNNAVDKLYSRNLGTGEGIELVKLNGEQVEIAIIDDTAPSYPASIDTIEVPETYDEVLAAYLELEEINVSSSTGNINRLFFIAMAILLLGVSCVLTVRYMRRRSIV